MKKLFSIEFIKTRGLEALTIGVLSLALTLWLVTVLNPYYETEFIALMWSFSLLALASYKWIPLKGLWRSFLLPLKWASIVTVVVIILSESELLDFEEDYILGQFVSFYAVVFLGNILLKNSPIFSEVKALFAKTKDKKNKPLVSIWLALAILSSLTFINHVSVSNAADGNNDRADEAYERADEAYDRADEAYSKANWHDH